MALVQALLAACVGCCCFLFMSAQALPTLRHLLAHNCWVPVSRLSYSLYLCHLLLPGIVQTYEVTRRLRLRLRLTGLRLRLRLTGLTGLRLSLRRRIG